MRWSSVPKRIYYLNFTNLLQKIRIENPAVYVTFTFSKNGRLSPFLLFIYIEPKSKSLSSAIFFHIVLIELVFINTHHSSLFSSVFFANIHQTNRGQLQVLFSLTHKIIKFEPETFFGPNESNIEQKSIKNAIHKTYF